MHNLGTLSAIHDARRLAHPYLSKPHTLNAPLEQPALASPTNCQLFSNCQLYQTCFQANC